MYTTDHYSPKGLLLERLHRNPDGSRWSIAWHYDDQWLLVEKRHSCAGGETAKIFSYRYDSLGRVAMVTMQTAEEGERVFESMQYPADGTRTQAIYPIRRSGIEGQTFGVSTELMLHMSMDAAAIMTVFDADGRPVRKVLYDGDDRVIHRVGFRYDERGLLAEEGELIGGQLRADFRNVFRHDTLGRKIEARKFWGDWGGERRTFAYNEQGHIALETRENVWEDRAPCVSTITRREIGYY